ncbi:efflux RND transporter periplasmic adaptor subunit [uncultured Thiodictyon sp.]|uniref:efflux RND transporter periplasmic adaptor subunit n=1 Tax=uncultured Thiodictyon sp. TaxID=1846217 RepID=UPI0025D998D5|nr:efflux RND transporter periplasmic adaptor subunit [uncultured Thiodictyon sp.]
MKKPLILLLVLALGAGGWWFYRSSHRGAGLESGPLWLYGNIDVRLVNLAFEVSGRIAGLPVSEGAQVAPAQALGRLDDRQLVQARDLARAQVDAQRAELDKRIAGTRPEEIEKLRADLAAARVESANAAHRAGRAQEMLKRRLGSPQDAEDATAAAKTAAARVDAAQAALDLGLAGSRAQDIAAAAAQLAGLEAALASAQLNLDYATLVAPAAGIVQNRILEVGDMASPDRPVYTIAITEPLWARVYLAEPDLGRVQPGQPARVMSDSFPGKSYPGWVGYISPSAEFTPKQVQTTELRADLVYQARVFVCNPAGELRQGMPVTVEIDLNAAPLGQPGCPPAAVAPPQSKKKSS